VGGNTELSSLKGNKQRNSINTVKGGNWPRGPTHIMPGQREHHVSMSMMPRQLHSKENSKYAQKTQIEMNSSSRNTRVKL
jgi:hypothetical protein